MVRPARPAPRVGALGAVRGHVELRQSLPRGRFLLFPALGDVPNSCSLPAEHADLVDSVRERYVTVEGWVVRSAESGLPESIEDGTGIEPIPSGEPGAALRAVGGIAPVPPGAVLPEEAVRILRDEP